LQGNFVGHQFRTNNYADSFLAPVHNHLAVYGIVGKASNTVMHINNRAKTLAAQSSIAATKAYLGMDNSSPTTFALADYAAIVVTAKAPTDAEVLAIKAALISAFNVPTDRTNVMVALPHSLTVEANYGVFNDSVWRQYNDHMSVPLEIGVVGVNGRSMGYQLNTAGLGEVLALYDASAATFCWHLSTPVNDVNGLGDMGGNPTTITANATTIFNNYMTVMATLLAAGPNAFGVIATGWPVNSFWLGDAQRKLDKAQVLIEVNQMLRDNATAGGYLISDEATINLAGALGDAVHTNRVGGGRRAAIGGPVTNNRIVNGP
jgi:hypothetical protein